MHWISIITVLQICKNTSAVNKQTHKDFINRTYIQFSQMVEHRKTERNFLHNIPQNNPLVSLKYVYIYEWILLDWHANLLLMVLKYTLTRAPGFRYQSTSDKSLTSHKLTKTEPNCRRS